MRASLIPLGLRKESRTCKAGRHYKVFLLFLSVLQRTSEYSVKAITEELVSLSWVK